MRDDLLICEVTGKEVAPCCAARTSSIPMHLVNWDLSDEDFEAELDRVRKARARRAASN